MYKKIAFISVLLITVSMILAMESDTKRARVDDTELVTIQTQEGQEFNIAQELAQLSLTLKNLIEDAGTDAPLPLPNISGTVWQKIQEMLPQIYTMLHDQRHALEAQQRLQGQLSLYDPTLLLMCINAINYLDIPLLLKEALRAAQQVDIQKVTPNDLNMLNKDLRNTYLKELTLRKLGPFKGDITQFNGRSATDEAVDRLEVVIKALCVNKAGTLLYSVSNDHTVRSWNTQTLEQLIASKLAISIGSSIVLDEAKRRLYIGKANGFIDVRDAQTLELIKSIHARADQKPYEAIQGLALIANHDQLITVSDALRVINVTNDQKVAEFVLPKEVIGLCASASHDGRSIVVGAGNTEVQKSKKYGLSFVCDMATGEIKQLDRHIDDVNAVYVLTDNRTCIVGCLDGLVNFYNIITGQLPKRLIFNLKDLDQMHICAGGTRMVVGTTTGIIELWDLQTGAVLAHAQLRPEIPFFDAFYNNVWSITSTQNAGIAFIGTQDGSIFKWDLSLLNQFATMNTVQSQVVLRYLQEGHVQGWDGIATIIHEKKARYIPARTERKNYKEED